MITPTTGKTTGVPPALSRAVDAIALYINVPFCERACSFCHYLPNLRFKYQDIPPNFMTLLLAQIQDVIKALPNSSKLVSVYLGGGTPSLLSDAQIDSLFEMIEPRLTSGAERSIEVHPSSWRPSLTRGGLFNRFSIGAQTFDRVRLQNWTRLEYSYEDVRSIIETMRASNSQCRINIDLLFENTVDNDDLLLASILEPNSITLYPRTGARPLGAVARTYREIQRAQSILSAYKPLSDRSFIFLKTPDALSDYARLEYECLGDVVGVGDWAVSLLGEDTFLSRFGSASFRFEPRSVGDRSLSTFLKAVPHGVPDRLWRQVEPKASPFLEPARPGLSRLIPSKTADFDAFLVSQGHSPRHLREFRRGVLFGADDPALLPEASTA